MAAKFRQCTETEAQSTNVLLNSKIAEHVCTNGEKLQPIVGAIVFCGRGNIALRGHMDNSFSLQNEAKILEIFKHFLAFYQTMGITLHFMIFLPVPPRNATYRSKTTQNEISNVSGDSIRDALVKEIEEAKFFSVLADEAAGISKIDEMALVLWFANRNGNICESFLGFNPWSEGLFDEAISQTILDAGKNLG